ATCAELDVVACNPRHTLVAADPQIVQRVHAAGLRIMVWTPNEPQDWEPLVAAGVDGIITDRPDRLRGFLQVRDGGGRLGSAPGAVTVVADGEVPAGARGPLPPGAQAAQV
ncbi:MAG TPA: glycerophosphodiester phosphodiesterase family protein, partial [Beutenbergiaceae bacterium]|nr:glycerophosphodiester phosphodiesterase family protein [Beutenbergiaceae bacterium]